MQIDWIMALCHRLQVHIRKAVPHGIDPLSMSIAITDLAADVDVRDALFVSLPDFRRRVLPGEGVDQINALFPPGSIHHFHRSFVISGDCGGQQAKIVF